MNETANETGHDAPYEVILHEGPLPPLGQSEQSKAEAAFIAALAESGGTKSRYSLWAQKTRTEWMSARKPKEETR